MNNFSNKLPIWYQLSQMLRADILGGRLKPGDQIDAEVRLAKQHGISVIPVRQALRALEEEGLIVRHRGSGTYVGPLASSAAERATSFESLYSREFTKPAKILDRGTITTPAHFESYFPHDASLAFVTRVAFRDGKPWSYGTLYFPVGIADEITTDLLTRYPLYRLMREKCSIELVRSHFEAKAIAAQPEAAGHLAIEPFSAALSLLCVTFDRNDRAAGAFQMTFPGDPFIFAFNTPHEPA
ncbi:GntR family transcriptional regulator [Novosphingobium sp.]|uniref:GntR family transcriptional regulator n=1 Tax=Novosphingobium sp. TaxID=1874826 RepID=UPI002FE3B2F4